MLRDISYDAFIKNDVFVLCGCFSHPSSRPTSHLTTWGCRGGEGLLVGELEILDR